MSNKGTTIKCYDGCAYRGGIPGNCHTRCLFDWAKSKLPLPKGNEHGIRNGWYMFPLNFDPVWMEEECKAYSAEKDPEKVARSNPIADLVSILAR